MAVSSRLKILKAEIRIVWALPFQIRVDWITLANENGSWNKTVTTW